MSLLYGFAYLAHSLRQSESLKLDNPFQNIVVFPQNFNIAVRRRKQLVQISDRAKVVLYPSPALI